jgi:hypothetical protein
MRKNAAWMARVSIAPTSTVFATAAQRDAVLGALANTEVSHVSSKGGKRAVELGSENIIRKSVTTAKRYA